MLLAITACIAVACLPYSSAAVAPGSSSGKPNIVWVVVDDLGWADFPWSGAQASRVKSPTLSKLAAEGTTLSGYYVNPICTPTRSSFMTGRYPIHLGLQHGVIEDAVPEHVPINETMVPEYMRKQGYKTHIVGKWHLGFHQKRYTPEARGFDTHFGYYTGNEEYWNHTSPCWHCGDFTALDLHRATSDSFEPVTDKSMQYSTNLFSEEIVGIVDSHAARNDPSPLFIYAPYEAVHGASSCFVAGGPANCSTPDGDELQAPQKYIDEQTDINDPFRKTFGGMLGALDEGVKNITEALKRAGALNNTIILVTTDNGAPSSHFEGRAMNNYPLRGGKGTLWEGGMRGAAFIWGAGVPKGVNNTKLFHAADWLPTFVALAGGEIPAETKAKLDGFDIWDAITTDAESPRTEILHNIDPKKGAAGIRVGDFKLLRNVGSASWSPRPGSGDLYGAGGGEDKNGNMWFFNIRNDPWERNNLYNNSDYAEKLKKVEAALARYEASAVPCRLCTAQPDPNAVPKVVEGLRICTPAPVDVKDPTKGSKPILCNDVGVWQPWETEE